MFGAFLSWLSRGAWLLALAMMSFAAGLAVPHPDSRADPDGMPPLEQENAEVFFDSGDPDVLHATIQATLVQAGTDQPFQGTGVPGIRLTVRGNGALEAWTVEGWANYTSSSNPSLCQRDTIHYLRYDWAYESENAGEGFFTTIPTTVPVRLAPDGDQCLPRWGATGPWTIMYCLEGKEGGPRGVRFENGRTRVDIWDRCESRTVQVRA